MNDETKALAKARLEHAQQCINSAKVLVNNEEDYRGAANRSYYAIFHSMKSVLALDRVDFSKHSGVISYFRKNYIKNHIFDDELSDIIQEAFDVRSDSDYDDFYVMSKAEVSEQICNAEKFYQEIQSHVLEEMEKTDGEK